MNFMEHAGKLRIGFERQIEAVSHKLVRVDIAQIDDARTELAARVLRIGDIRGDRHACRQGFTREIGIGHVRRTDRVWRDIVVFANVIIIGAQGQPARWAKNRATREVGRSFRAQIRVTGRVRAI